MVNDKLFVMSGNGGGLWFVWGCWALEWDGVERVVREFGKVKVKGVVCTRNSVCVCGGSGIGEEVD